MRDAGQAVRYTDRREAGRELGRLLAAEFPTPAPDMVVLALPRGGVPVAVEVAGALGAPLDVVVVRKLGLPGQPEVGAGAVTEDGVVFLDEPLLGRVRLTAGELEPVVAAERAELARRVRSYRRGGAPVPLAGRTAVVVDDGLARGVTAVAAVRAVRARGAAVVVLAVPVASGEGLRRLVPECDAVVCPTVVERFGAVGRYYRDFAQVSDTEVRILLGGGSPRRG
ncbi:MAG: putative phosphoribosyl transferase [Actinomycetota bacterium]|nr:putative phosphoribosyl transferase [Actinomycetota bacterium]